MKSVQNRLSRNSHLLVAMQRQQPAPPQIPQEAAPHKDLCQKQKKGKLTKIKANGGVPLQIPPVITLVQVYRSNKKWIEKKGEI